MPDTLRDKLAARGVQISDSGSLASEQVEVLVAGYDTEIFDLNMKLRNMVYIAKRRQELLEDAKAVGEAHAAARRGKNA